MYVMYKMKLYIRQHNLDQQEYIRVYEYICIYMHIKSIHKNVIMKSFFTCKIV